MELESIEKKNDVPRSQEVELREQVVFWARLSVSITLNSPWFQSFALLCSRRNGTKGLQKGRSLGRNYTAARHSAVTRIRDVAVDCWVARLDLARYVINPKRSSYKKRSHQAQSGVQVANCS
jgi:hypothetical protein